MQCDDDDGTLDISPEETARSLARAVTNVAVKQLLAEEMKQQTYTLVHKNMLEQP